LVPNKDKDKQEDKQKTKDKDKNKDKKQPTHNQNGNPIDCHPPKSGEAHKHNNSLTGKEEHWCGNPNVNVGEAITPSHKLNGVKNSKPNAKRAKMERMTRKQRTSKALHHSSRSHVPTMPAPLEMVSPALFKGIHS